MCHRITYLQINCQQNRVVDQSKLCAQIYLPKNCKLHKFATTNSNFEKINYFRDMHHHKTYMYINFQQNRVKKISHNRAHKFIRKNIASCIHLQLQIIILKKSTLSDMHHRKTYMYINFQQNRISRSIKTVYTDLFAKKCKLHKLVTCN